MKVHVFLSFFTVYLLLVFVSLDVDVDVFDNFYNGFVSFLLFKLNVYIISNRIYK